MPAYPGVNGVRPADSTYVVIPAYIQKYTPAELQYLVVALGASRAIYGQGEMAGPARHKCPNMVNNDDLMPVIDLVFILVQDVTASDRWRHTLRLRPSKLWQTANLKFLLATAQVEDFVHSIFLEMCETMGFTALPNARTVPNVGGAPDGRPPLMNVVGRWETRVFTAWSLSSPGYVFAIAGD
eukprot:5880416-Amphidinium_carterae.1